MGSERPGYVNIDELMPRITLEQAAAYYGVPLPELHHTRQEVRCQCFLNCGRTEETGDRALAIKVDHPAKQWKCHEYDCGKGSNLVGLCDLMKPGPNADGRPRGERFKEIAADLQAMVGGVARSERPLPQQAKPPAEPVEPEVSVPLAESLNERARALVNLDEKFIVDVGQMNPKAAAYFRKRPFLTPDVCRRWRMGYLPRDAGGDKSGGTMRGKVVYALLSEGGEVLTWFGRDPEFEEKHQQWLAAGKPPKDKPAKHRFVSGFHRGLEIFGQHRLGDEAVQQKIRDLGFLVVVEGPNDLIGLDTLGVPGVGLCSNAITKEQVEKVANWAHRLTEGRVVVLDDCEPERERQSKDLVFTLAEHCSVRRGWSPSSQGGRFRGRQPESLTREEWEEMIRPALLGRV